MIVHRTVFINPVEPEYLAFRISSGVDTKVDFHFKKQDGKPHPEDVVAQLQLTSRTGDLTEYFSCPAIDAVNGVARAFIPAGLRHDPNGWRLRLTGTVDTEPRVLAYGVVTAVAGAGPQVEPQDVIDNIPLTFARNEEVNLNVTLWADASKSSGYDLTATGTTINAFVRTAPGGTLLTPFAVAVVDEHVVNLYLTPDQVNVLPDDCWWSLVASTGAGTTTLCEGSVTVTGVIEAPLPVTTDSWTYVKPATADAPTTGQIVHSNIGQNILRISVLSQPGTDRVPLLDDLEPEDRITIGATTWTVRFKVYDALGWYDVGVTPVVQDASSGVVPVLFEPPV